MSTIYDYLIGEEVCYKNKECVNGKIVCFTQTSDEIFIHVSPFDSTNNEVKKFLFPFSFRKKTLYSNSPAITNTIKNIACRICGETENCVKFANNYHYCKKCYSELVECIHCSNKTHPSNAHKKDFDYFSKKYNYVCSDCNHFYRICPTCNIAYYIPERTEFFPKIPDSNQECIACLEDKCLQCSNCEEMYLPEDMIIKDYLHICKSCFDSSTYICPSCGRIAIKRYDSSLSQEICGACEENERCNERYIGYCKELLAQITISKSTRHMIDFKTLKNHPHSQLVDRLSHCYEPYIDALLIHFDDFILVLVYDDTSRPKKYLQNNYSRSITMTDFKKTHTYYWRDIVHETQNFQIIQETNFKFHIWKNPYKIRAVTSRDKDFRKEYYGGYLEYEGNNYGDTSDFFIIGSLHND